MRRLYLAASLTVHQQRLVGGQRGGGITGGGARRPLRGGATPSMTAERDPVAMEDPEEELPSVENTMPFLLQREQEALTGRSWSVLEVSVTLHWPMVQVTDIALQLMS